MDFGQFSMEQMVVHHVGNKVNNENFLLSDSPIDINNELRDLLVYYFIHPFKGNDFFRLFHKSDLFMNVIYECVSNIFMNPNNLYDCSVRMASHLYEVSLHPRIKGGEFYVVYFKSCLINGTNTDAIGLFKSETKDTFLKVYPVGSNFEISSETGININRLDKGCLIFNIEPENGYLVSIVDNINKGGDAKFWTEDFLNVKPQKDSIQQTKQLLSICRDFIKDECVDNKANQALLANKAINAMKNETVDMNIFAGEVFGEYGLEENFNKFRKKYADERNLIMKENFEVAPKLLRGHGVGTMKTIKLDKHFDITIHGGDNFIERGYDDVRGMNFYKIFFENER